MWNVKRKATQKENAEIRALLTNSFKLRSFFSLGPTLIFNQSIRYLWYLLQILDMNAFDKHRKGFTAWCQDCSEVFDQFWTASTHRDQKGHNITVTEFWITGKRV